MFDISGADIINFTREFGVWTLFTLIIVISAIVGGYKRDLQRQKDQKAIRAQNSRLRKAESEERKKTMELLLKHIQDSSEKMATLTVEVSKGVDLLKENMQFLENEVTKLTECTRETDKDCIARFNSLQSTLDAWNSRLSEINLSILEVAKGGRS